MGQVYSGLITSGTGMGLPAYNLGCAWIQPVPDLNPHVAPLSVYANFLKKK